MKLAFVNRPQSSDPFLIEPFQIQQLIFMNFLNLFKFIDKIGLICLALKMVLRVDVWDITSVVHLAGGRNDRLRSGCLLPVHWFLSFVFEDRGDAGLLELVRENAILFHE